MRWDRALAGLACLALGCSSTGAPAPPALSPCARVPTDGFGIAAFVEARCYEQWPGEAAARPAEMAAGGARVFWHPILDASLLDGAATHPVGSAAVREIYHEDLETLRGWAVSLKVAEDPGDGSGWLWVEHWADTGTVTAQRGVPGCVGCHAAGADYVQSR